MIRNAQIVDKHGTGSESSSAFDADTILPSQFFTKPASNSADYPEKRLMLAVLEEAVATYQRFAETRTRHGEKLFLEAEEWINSPNRDWPYSSENICHALGIDPEYLRRGLAAWKEAQGRTQGAKVYRFPFRRMNGRRNSITLREPGLRKSA